MNVKALLHESPSDLHRRPRHDPTDTNTQWPQRHPPSPPRRPSYPPSAQPPSSTHPSPAMASLRPIDSPRLGIDPSASHSANPAAVTPTAAMGRRIPTPTPLTAPSSVTGHGVWSPDRSSGSDFLKERDTQRDLRDWDRAQRDQRDQRRDQLRDRERTSLHPPPSLPPPLAAFGDPPRRKNIAMEVNGPLAGPGIPSPDDLAARGHHSGSSSRRPSISNSTIDVGKKMASPTEDEIRGREPQQRLQEIQLKERSVREPSRERERENWDNDHGYQRNGPRKIIKAYNPYAPEQTRDYRYINSGLDGPGIPPSGDYRGPYRMQPPGQPPPPQHPSMRDGGRTTPKAEIVVLNRSNATGPPVTTSERDRERDSGPGPSLNERERDRDRERMERERSVLHSQYGDRDRDREREWEREHGMHIGYPDSERERGPPPPPMGSAPPHSSHPSLPPPSLPHGHGSHPHPHSHSHSHGHSHHHQHHSQHREQGSQSHSHHGITHHRPSSSGPHHHQPPGPHRGPSHPHGHSSSRHAPQPIHHPQPQPPGQIQLLPHPQPQHSHSHAPHPHSHSQSHSHPHPSQPPPSHPPSSQPHSPHAVHMHGPPPSQPHPAYRSQPPPAPGPLGGEMSPHHHHHHHHHPTTPSHPSGHHPPAVPPPPQRQFQTQFHTQFIPGIPQPGSRMGSPIPGPIPHQQQQQQRVQVPPQSQGGPPNTGGPPSQQQLPPSGSKSVGLGLIGVPGLDPVDANNNVAAKRDSPHLGKRTLAGIKPGDKERDGPVPLDKNGGRRSYMDVDDAGVVEEAENDASHVVVTSEESEEEREFKANVQVNLGTFVYPRLPFPYFFDLGRGIHVNAEKRDGDSESERKKSEDVEQDAEKVDQSSVEVKSTEKNDEKKDDQENGPVVDKCDDIMDVDNKEKDKNAVPKEDKDLLDLETRVTVIIPNGHIPHERPLRPRLWGGGILERDSSKDAKADSRVDSRRTRTGKRGQPEFPMNTNEDKQIATAQKRRRRIYTDDSDLFLCALHSGWLTWSGAVQAKGHGKDMKLDLRVIRCCGAPGGARLIENVTGREEVVGRFLGGCGEKCFNDAGKKSKEQGPDKKKGKEREDEDNNKDVDQQPDTIEAEDSAEDDASDSDDDGRGLTSAAWGSGHDGSAIEVLGIEFLEQKATARTSSGLGLRNRPQRMWEYNERRMAILGFAASNARGPLTRLAGRKRRRACDWQLSYPRRLPNAALLDTIAECEEEEDRGLAVDDDYPEEQSQMSIHTVVFGIGEISTGFKYVPSVLQDVLFPTLDCQPPPKKRRKVDDSADVEMADGQPSAPRTPRNRPRPIVLLTESEQYLLSPCTAEQAAGDDLLKYDVSLLASNSSQTAESTTTTVTNGNGQALEPKTDVKPLKLGIGQPSFCFLKEEIVIEEDLKIRICRWRWGPPSVAN